MVVELDVAGVEDLFVESFEKDSGRAHYMARVAKSSLDPGVPDGFERFAVVSTLPDDSEVFDFVVGEEGVSVDAQFGALAHHDVDGVVEHGVGEIDDFRGHVDAGVGLVALQDG